MSRALRSIPRRANALAAVLVAWAPAIAARCSGYNCSSCGGVEIQWARTRREYEAFVSETAGRQRLRPELMVARDLGERWELMRHILRRSRARSVLDVGGIGSYFDVVRRCACQSVRLSEPLRVHAPALLSSTPLLLAGTGASTCATRKGA
jgi:hypothetical protein